MTHDEHPWTPEDAAEHYGIREWGSGLFDVSPRGEVTVMVNGGASKHAVSLLDIVEGLRQRDLAMPVLLRVENHLDAAITQINEAFAQAIRATGYTGVYRGVFPIKVNQQAHIIEEIARFGARYHHGLEAGSKAELLVAMAMLRDRESLIVCNGYKDEEFIDLGLRARQLGMSCIFVVETPEEMSLIIERSRTLGVEPMIGARLKLGTKVDGHWSEDSGDRSLFGLNTQQLIEAVDLLKAANMLHCLRLVHFHLGSQIPNIQNIRAGIREACRYYIDLVEEGAPLGYLDIGGGLAVDYDGSRGGSQQSRNYSLQEYAIDVVEAIQESLDPEEIAHPTIVSESGRATVAYTSVLLFNILTVSQFEPGPLPPSLPEDAPDEVKNLAALVTNISAKNVQECYNDAVYYLESLRMQFKRGEIRLRMRSIGENYYLAVLQRIARLIPTLDRVPIVLENLTEQLADIYYGNFSVFQSLPDFWAIGQTFPVMPIHRLGEEPSREAIIADLTCDCDGKIDRFAHPEGEKPTLRLHPVEVDNEYYLAVFLVGAYQETLGDLHNLFGDTNVASVRINGDGSFDFVHEMQGDTIADVLSYVEYEPDNLFRRFRNTAEDAVREGRISVAERQQMLGAFTESLRGYTYFER
ncbi:MAG: biosynthetic arginine decarboxylase [Pseudomonadota bacterium]|nr:biosynthetic arginine decarboxylase [Pseudomonadota bacterium]